MRRWETITYSVRYTISLIMVPGDTVNSDSTELLLWYIQIPALSRLYIPYIVLLIPDSDRRLSHNVSVSSELILKYFGWEIRWSKTTIRTSPLKSTGPGSWGADKRSIQAFWILLSKQASPRFEAIRKLFSWHGMGNNNLLFWIIPSSHNSMCEKSIH